MIQVFRSDKELKRLENIELSALTADFDRTDCWFHLSNPTDKEIELVGQVTAFPTDMLKAALDEEERAHISEEDGVVLTLFDIPTMEEDDEEDYYTYSTIPLSYIHDNKSIVTVTLCEQTIIINNFINGRVKGFSTQNRNTFLLQILYTVSTKYLQYLRLIDRASHRIQTELHRSMKNKELIQLLDLENSLVYFSTSLRANGVIIDRIKRIMAENFTPEDEDLWEDVVLENGQAIEMCNTYRDVLSGTMDAFASVISNNLNILMKTLTIITIIMAIPTLIASFFGMNTGVPWQSELTGFYIVISISVAACLLAGFIFFYPGSGKRGGKGK